MPGGRRLPCTGSSLQFLNYVLGTGKLGPTQGPDHLDQLIGGTVGLGGGDQILLAGRVVYPFQVLGGFFGIEVRTVFLLFGRILVSFGASLAFASRTQALDLLPPLLPSPRDLYL